MATNMDMEMTQQNDGDIFQIYTTSHGKLFGFFWCFASPELTESMQLIFQIRIQQGT